MFTRATALALTLGAFTFGCSSATPGDENQEIIDNLVQAGYPASDIQISDGKVFVGNDAEVSLAASREMLESDAGEEQYRTTNLVSQTIGTICINGSAFTGAFSTALDGAISRYNAQGLAFTMRRTTGSTTGCGATITMRISGPTGGSSGFPSGGRPFNTVNIGSGLSTFPGATIRHVIMHELGHTIGFRHSDFFNRAISCGGVASNEGTAGVGATLIPGTPSGATVGGSVMNACFRTNEAGAFTSSDVTALQFLY